MINDNALTVDEVIEKLQQIKRVHGGGIPFARPRMGLMVGVVKIELRQIYSKMGPWLVAFPVLDTNGIPKDHDEWYE